MNDLVPGFVYTNDLIRQANETEKWVASKFRRERVAKWGWQIFALTGWGLVIILGVALDAAVPGIRLLPVMFWQRPDGTTDFALTTDMLPADLSDINIQAWLWQYVQWRESYSYAEYVQAGYRVCVMSSEAVCAAFQGWADGKNKESPAAIFSTHGVIRTSLREVTHFERATAAKAGEYAVHFDRQVTDESDPHPRTETWAVTLKFLQNYDRGFRINDIRSFNPSRIVVIAYPGPQVLTPVPSSAVHGGAR